MAFSKESKLGDLLQNTAATEVLEKHMPGVSSNAQIKMASSLSLSAVAGFAGIAADALDAMDKELQSIA